MSKKELEERDKIIDLLEKKRLINIEGDEEGIALRLNSDNEEWCGENILDIFKEGMNYALHKSNDVKENESVIGDKNA